VSALRKLKTNPHNKEALGTIFNIQQQVTVIVTPDTGSAKYVYTVFQRNC